MPTTSVNAKPTVPMSDQRLDLESQEPMPPADSIEATAIDTAEQTVAATPPSTSQGQTVPARPGRLDDVPTPAQNSDIPRHGDVIVRDHRKGRAHVDEPPGQPAWDGHGYPRADDADGWTQFVNRHGADAFTKAWKSGYVDKSVFEDKQFALALQTSMDTDNRLWTLMSNIIEAQSRVLDQMVSNLRG